MADMYPYLKTEWIDRVVEKPNTFTMVENSDGTITLIPAPGQVIERGTPLNADNLNKIENCLKFHDGLLANVGDWWSNADCTITTGSGGTSFRFPNGLQINIMQIWGTWNITTAWGSVYSSPHITPSNYTQAFLTPPQVSVTAHGAGTAVMVSQAGAPTTTMPGTYYLWKPVQQTSVKDYIEIISIGRWK